MTMQTDLAELLAGENGNRPNATGENAMLFLLCYRAEILAQQSRIETLQSQVETLQLDTGMAACMATLQHELVAAGVVGPDIPPMFYPEAIGAIARERDALRARIDGSVTGTVERVGDDESGQPRVLIFLTRDDLLHGPNIACKRVALVVE